MFGENGKSSDNACTSLFRERVLKEYLPDVLRSVEELPLARKICSAILSLLDDVHAGFVRKVKTIGG